MNLELVWTHWDPHWRTWWDLLAFVERTSYKKPTAHFIYSYLLLAIRKSVATNVMLLAITRISDPCESKTLCKSFMYFFLAIEDWFRDSWILLPKIISLELKWVSLHQYFQIPKRHWSETAHVRHNVGKAKIWKMVRFMQNIVQSMFNKMVFDQ